MNTSAEIIASEVIFVNIRAILIFPEYQRELAFDESRFVDSVSH